MTTITLSQISGSLCRAWSAAMGTTPPTIYPQMFANTDQWSTWYELIIESWTPRWPRAGDPVQGSIDVRVTVCAKPTITAAQVTALLEQARLVFSGQAIAVRSSSSDPIVGRVRFQDAVVQNQSEKTAHPGGQLWQLQWTGNVLAEQ
ncbi:hypothetical protein GC163_07815 [bacterium]|nr:hypothetical protein [bacterium]